VAIGTVACRRVVEDEVRRRRPPGPIRSCQERSDGRRASMLGQFRDSRNALAIAYLLGPRRHRQQGMPAFTRVQFFSSYVSGAAHTPRFVQCGLGSAIQSRAGSARAGGSSRPGWLAVWPSCTFRSSGTSGVSEQGAEAVRPYTLASVPRTVSAP
jgi:hypothetical protein